PWAERKVEEFDKFAQVEAWVNALLNLTSPVIGASAVISASGMLAGVAGAGAGGPGAGVLSGTAGATTGLGIGTAATVSPTPAATVDPDAIAAAIATALGTRLDALGTRIASLEARGGRRQACADLVHEAAKLRSQLTLLKGIHPFGKLPMKALEANAFPAMVYALPELVAEECELDELPAGKEATQEHLRAFVHMLQARVSEFQMFVKAKRLLHEDEGRLKMKDGELTVVPKTKKCKDMDEWERGFFRIMCEAPLEAQEDLVDFLAWAKTIAADFTFYHFSEFYEHLIRQVQRSTVGISLEGYDRVWRIYQQQHRLKPGVKKKRSDYKW
ncbi:hypothetical protein CYMTET_44713, partial [Cymbomonas tetramitiformis]